MSRIELETGVVRHKREKEGPSERRPVPSGFCESYDVSDLGCPSLVSGRIAANLYAEYDSSDETRVEVMGVAETAAAPLSDIE